MRTATADNGHGALWKKQSAPGRYSTNSLGSCGRNSDSSFRKSSSPADFAHVRPRVDTGLVGLGLKKSNSAARVRDSFAAPTAVAVQKRSEPSVLPSQQARTISCGGPFKVPDRPPGSGAFNRNSAQRQSLTRLFSRNGDKAKKGSADAKGQGPFGETGGGSGSSGGGELSSGERRSQFLKKRSITSLSLFSGSGTKKEEDHGGGHAARQEPAKVSNNLLSRFALFLENRTFIQLYTI